MKRKDYDKIDPEQYETRYEKSPREDYSRKHWRPLIVAAISKYCKNKMVLDLGCGTGAYTTLITEYTSRALGLDISKTMVNYARNKNANLNLALADACHVPLRAESIDTVICIGLFEYIERAIALEEIARVLNRDGICVIGCPNKYSAVRMPSKIICKILGKKYFCKEPSHGETLRLLRQNRFKVIESRMDDGLIYLPNFLDRLMGKGIYLFIERFFKTFGRNPFSNVMLFVLKKKNDEVND